MSDDPRLIDYSAKYRCEFVGKLGFGREGDVFATDRRSAVKFLRESRAFDRELEVYQTLSRYEIRDIAGFNVPRLLRFDAGYRTIEMSVVDAPFVLDFAGALTEMEAAMSEFDEDVIEEHHARLQKLYGDRWTDVLMVADVFTRLTGFVLMDIKPGNISFGKS